MHIGIIIPAFNVAPWLSDAIRSVLSQSYRDRSLVVVDDGSADATARVAATFCDPRIHLIRQPNRGVSSARNRGLATVTADAILFLDGDDWLAPEALAILSSTLADCPWAVAVASSYARASAGGPTRHVAPPPSGALLQRLLVRNLFVNGGQVLIRRPAIDAIGGFKCELSYGEDWEFWTRLALQGEFISIRTPAPLLFVRERAGSVYHSAASDPARFIPSMDAVYRNPAIVARFDAGRLARLRLRAEAEVAWVVGREMTRHGRMRDGRAWLVRSLFAAPSLKRLGLLGVSWMRVGPFRSYESRSGPDTGARRFGQHTKPPANNFNDYRQCD